MIFQNVVIFNDLWLLVIRVRNDNLLFFSRLEFRGYFCLLRGSLQALDRLRPSRSIEPVLVSNQVELIFLQDTFYIHIFDVMGLVFCGYFDLCAFLRTELNFSVPRGI